MEVGFVGRRHGALVAAVVEEKSQDHLRTVLEMGPWKPGSSIGAVVMQPCIAAVAGMDWEMAGEKMEAFAEKPSRRDTLRGEVSEDET